MPAKINWTPEMLAAVVDLRTLKATWNQVARRVGVSVETLWELRRRQAGQPWAERPAHRILPETVAVIIDLRVRHGLSWIAISERVGHCLDELVRLRREHAGEQWTLALPRRHDVKNWRPAFDRDVLNPPSGESLAAIARRYGVSKATVSGRRWTLRQRGAR